MTDKNAITIIKPDAKTLTALESWFDKLSITDKTGFVVDTDKKVVISHEDPLNELEVKRTELIELVELNAEGATAVVEITFNGTEIESISTKIMRVADPKEEEDNK